PISTLFPYTTLFRSDGGQPGRRRVAADSADLQLTLRHERRGVEARRRRPGDGKGFAGIGRQRGFDRGFEAGARMTRLVMGDLTIYVENLIRGGNWPKIGRAHV